MKCTQIFQKLFFFFLFLALAAGCRSSQTREESSCVGLPAKNQEILVAQVEQPVQKNVVANQGKTTTQKPEETKQEVKTVPPSKQKTEAVVQVPVEKKASTNTEKKGKTSPKTQGKQQPEPKPTPHQEEKVVVLPQKQQLVEGVQPKPLGQEKVETPLVKKEPEGKVQPDPQVKVEVGKKEGASSNPPLVTRPEEKVTQVPTVQQGEKKVVRPEIETPAADPETPAWSSYWLWIVGGVVLLLGLWLRTRRAARRLALLEEEQFWWLYKVNHPYAEVISDRERAKHTRLFKRQPEDNQSTTEETKKEVIEAAPVLANAEPSAAEVNQRVVPELAVVLEEDEAAEESVSASEKTQLRGGAPAAVVKENAAEAPQKKEEGRSEETSAVVEKKEASLSEAEWQRLLRGIREAGTEYPAGNPTVQRALEEAKAAEKAFKAACDELLAAKKMPEAVRHELAVRKVALAVQKANRWYLYWQEASYDGAAGSDLKIYCQAKYEKAERDLAKARQDQKKFEAKLKPLQKKGGKKKQY